MLRTSTLLIAAITLAVPAAPAFAETKKQKKERKEKEAKEKADAEAAAAAEAEAAAAAEKAAAEAAAAPPEAEAATEDASGAVAEPAMEGATAGSWSMSIIDRPLNLLKGMIRVGGDLGIAKISVTTAGVPPAPPTTTISTGVLLNVGGGYGISDKLEAGVGYGISLKEFSAKGPLTLYGLFSLTHSPKMRISAGATFGFATVPDAPFIAAGLAFQYHLGPKMMVFMTPDHLQMGLDPFTVSINLPVGFGFQATPNIFASATTNLFNLNLKPSGGNTFIFADSIPLALTGSYSPSNKMDIGASFGASDLPSIADTFAFTVFARLYFGKVPASGGAAAAAVPDAGGGVEPPPM